jgi:hypothetical protein
MTKKTSSRVRGSTRTLRTLKGELPQTVEEVQEHLRRLRLSLELLQPRLQASVDYLVNRQVELQRQSPKKDQPQQEPSQPF